LPWNDIEKLNEKIVETDPTGLGEAYWQATGPLRKRLKDYIEKAKAERSISVVDPQGGEHKLDVSGGEE
jgi:hypothetical protein